MPCRSYFGYDILIFRVALTSLIQSILVSYTSDYVQNTSNFQKYRKNNLIII